MRAMIFSMFSLILSASAFADASGIVAKFDCGRAYGMPVSLTIRTAPQSAHMPLTGTLIAPGKDATTGTLLRSVTTELVGTIEMIGGERVYVMAIPSNPFRQVYAGIGAKGSEQTVAEVLIKRNDLEVLTERQCKVVQ